MKKILLLSDTHSYIDENIIKYVKQADEVWHAGDIGNLLVTDEIKKLKPLRAVFGNIDDAKTRKEFPENNRFKCEDVDVWITHIGGYPGRYDLRIKDEIKKNPPKLFIIQIIIIKLNKWLQYTSKVAYVNPLLYIWLDD